MNREIEARSGGDGALRMESSGKIVRLIVRQYDRNSFLRRVFHVEHLQPASEKTDSRIRQTPSCPETKVKPLTFQLERFVKKVCFSSIRG
jgi:hypothetical protein